MPSNPPPPLSACRAALAQGLRATAPNTPLDGNGYVADPAQNLIEGVHLADIEADLRQGSGNELAGKFRAAHASSALAVNCFAPFKTAPEALPLPGGAGFTSLHFERKCPHGLRHGTRPNKTPSPALREREGAQRAALGRVRAPARPHSRSGIAQIRFVSNPGRQSATGSLMHSTTLRAIALAAIGASASALTAHAQKLTTLHGFTGKPDGEIPAAGLIHVGSSVFGTTQYGGSANNGTVYKIDLNSGKETILYSFTGQQDGGSPYAGLTSHGKTLYGTTLGGGADGYATVFAIDSKTGAETVLYSFKGPPDGFSPQAALMYQGGYLYGTTFDGGAGNAGTLFKVNVATGAETVLHSFTGGSGGSPADGGEPYSNVVYKSGILYGTTQFGGSVGDGTIFSYNLATGTETVVVNLNGGTNGGQPTAGMILVHGKLYGTTKSGGELDGTIFEFDPATGTESVLYNFTGGNDGGLPLGGLVYENGAFYGTASFGGAGSNGTVFKVGEKTGVEITLHAFTGQDDGAYPNAGLIYQGGLLYGATPYGGASGDGTAFQIVP